MPKPTTLTAKQRDAFLSLLRTRFEAHMHRHADLQWARVQARLESNNAKIWSLHEMEQSGGEPDVVDLDSATGEIVFVDCSAQSPKARRSVCYDREALDARKEHKPKNSAVEMAAAMGRPCSPSVSTSGSSSAVHSTRRRPAGCKRRSTSGSSVARCSAIADTIRSSCTTTVPTPIMPLGASGAR